MPHIIIEYNLAVNKALNVNELVQDLHQVAMAHDALPTGGIRTRAHLVDVANIGDGDDANGFIYITVRLGQGRAPDVKKDIGDKLFSALTTFTQSHFEGGKPLSLGLEIQEIEKDWTWKKNNIHQIIKDKTNGPE